MSAGSGILVRARERVPGAGWLARARDGFRRWRMRRREQAYLDCSDHRIMQELLAHRGRDESAADGEAGPGHRRQ